MLLKNLLLLPLVSLLLVTQVSCQTTTNTSKVLDNQADFMQDTTAIMPNHVRVIAQVVAVKGNTIELTIEEMLGEGQGIVNPLSKGQHIKVKSAFGVDPVKDNEKELPGLTKGDLFKADLREQISLNASETHYKLFIYQLLKE